MQRMAPLQGTKPRTVGLYRNKGERSLGLSEHTRMNEQFRDYIEERTNASSRGPYCLQTVSPKCSVPTPEILGVSSAERFVPAQIYVRFLALYLRVFHLKYNYENGSLPSLSSFYFLFVLSFAAISVIG